MTHGLVYLACTPQSHDSLIGRRAGCPRHEYFRRILCNLIGGEADRGELPSDFGQLSQLVEAICFGNAKRHFGFDV